MPPITARKACTMVHFSPVSAVVVDGSYCKIRNQPILRFNVPCIQLEAYFFVPLTTPWKTGYPGYENVPKPLAVGRRFRMAKRIVFAKRLPAKEIAQAMVRVTITVVFLSWGVHCVNKRPSLHILLKGCIGNLFPS